MSIQRPALLQLLYKIASFLYLFCRIILIYETLLTTYNGGRPDSNDLAHVIRNTNIGICSDPPPEMDIFMRITLDEIARMANVSKTTVSRVINGITAGVGEPTRRRVLRIVEELGYDAQTLSTGRGGGTKTIGMIIPDLANPFFSSVSMEVSRCAAEQGYTVLLCCTADSPEREEEAVTTLVSKRVEGVLLISSFSDWQEFHHRLEKYRVPCVLMDRKISGDSMGVFVDNEYAFYMAASYLIRCGHHRIAVIGGPESAPTTWERVEGYRSAFHTSGIRWDEGLIRYGGFNMETGFRAVMELAAEDCTYTAALAGNDSIAVGMMKALKRLGRRIPDDIELIGFDNTQLADIVEPALSTIKQPVGVLAETAVRVLLDAIGGTEPEERIVRLKSSLILRGTTRPRADIVNQV